MMVRKTVFFSVALFLMSCGAKPSAKKPDQAGGQDWMTKVANPVPEGAQGAEMLINFKKRIKFEESHFVECSYTQKTGQIRINFRRDPEEQGKFEFSISKKSLKDKEGQIDLANSTLQIYVPLKNKSHIGFGFGKSSKCLLKYDVDNPLENQEVLSGLLRCDAIRANDSETHKAPDMNVPFSGSFSCPLERR